MNSQTLFSFFKVFLPIWRSLAISMNFSVSFSTSAKKVCWNFDRDCIVSVHSFCLFSFTQYDYIEVHPSWMYKQFFLIAEQHSIVRIYHNLFIHSSSRTFGLFLVLGYEKRSCHEQLSTNLCVDTRFHFSWVRTYKQNGWVLW